MKLEFIMNDESIIQIHINLVKINEFVRTMSHHVRKDGGNYVYSEIIFIFRPNPNANLTYIFVQMLGD